LKALLIVNIMGASWGLPKETGYERRAMKSDIVRLTPEELERRMAVKEATQATAGDSA
jgi:hypothetical protein